MTNVSEGLKDAAKAAQGDALYMTDLLDRTFQIVQFQVGESPSAFRDEKFRWNLTDIILEGEDGATEVAAFLSASRINRQLDWLKENDLLPIRVKLIRCEDHANKPWELVTVDSDSPLTAAAKKAGAKEVGRNKDALKNFRNEDGSIKWHYFLERWQGEGLGLDQLGDVIGAIAPQALEHWFKADKTRTITTLKEAALAGRTPAEEELPFE